jgi:hypothetical protein
MRSAQIIHSVSDGWSRSAFLALLLAGALLLCHGVYGASHQVFSTLPAEQPQHSHASQAEHINMHDAGGVGEQHPTEHQGGDSGGHLGHVAYAAALLTISLRAVLLWLLSGTRTWIRNVVPSLPERVFQPVFLSPPRRPALPLIQVFRL